MGGREAGELSSDSPDSDEDDKVVASVCRDGGEYRASLDTANGKQCNLKDHRVMAGCTAIVAFLVGKSVYTIYTHVTLCVYDILHNIHT